MLYTYIRHASVCSLELSSIYSLQFDVLLVVISFSGCICQREEPLLSGIRQGRTAARRAIESRNTTPRVVPQLRRIRAYVSYRANKTSWYLNSAGTLLNLTALQTATL
jgi:hypothetical protein